MQQAPQWTVALALTLLLACAGGTEAGRRPATPRADTGASASASDQEAPRRQSPIPVSPEDPTWGNEDAPVTVFYFSDLECSYCSRVHSTIETLKSKYGPSKLRIVFSHTPLAFHKRAKPAARAATAVHALAGNEAFWRFVALALADQHSLTEDNFVSWAGVAGIGRAEFLHGFESAATLHSVEEDLRRAERAGVKGTPSFLINGRSLTGAQPVSEFDALIEQELIEAAKLVAAGEQASNVSALRTTINFKPPAQQVEQSPAETTVWRILLASDDPQRGSPDALVTIVAWSDLECPYCARAEGTLEELLKIYGNDLRVVWKDNPLPFHKQARAAAYFAREAYVQGGNEKFWQVQRLLYERQEALGAETFEAIALEVGLDWSRAKLAIDAGTHAKRIRASEDQAAEFGVRGTPHFFINGKALTGAQPLARFRSIVDERLADARQHVASGTPRSAVYDAIMKAAESPPGPEWRTPPAVPVTAPRRGAADAKVVVQVFSDFECSFCGRIRGTLDKIVANYGDRVLLVWRNLPLPMHKNAQYAAEAAHEVYLQKGDTGFWKFHDLLFDNQQAMSPSDIEGYAREVGVDLKVLSEVVQERTHQERIEQDAAAARGAGVNGTPGTLINGYFLGGAQPYASFERLIEYALKHPTPAEQ